MNLYDAHLHLQADSLDPHLDRIVADLSAEGVIGAVVNGTSTEDWPRVKELAMRFPWVIPSYGLHPWRCGNRPTDWQRQLTDRIRSHPQAHIGEIGLDRWMLHRASPEDPRLAGLSRAPLDEQIEVFAWQLELAASHDRAASIHCIDAWGALRETLHAAKLPSCGFLIHAYAGPVEMIKPLVALGAYFSFNGSYLGPKQIRRRETFKSIPSVRLLVETDAPSMPLDDEWRRHNLPTNPAHDPINHPANIGAIYDGLAAFLDLPAHELAKQVEANFHRLFDLPTNYKSSA